MAVREIVKVTSKGQLTLPSEVRRTLSLGEGSYLYVTRVGKLIVMKKVGELTLDEISAVLQRSVREGGLRRELLMREVEKAREELLEERYAKA